MSGTTRVYVGRLPYRAKERDLDDFFYKFGRLRDVIIKNGFAFVEFDDPRDAEDAAHYMNGKELCGERVIVELTKRPPKGKDAYRTNGTRYLADRYGRSGRYGGGGGGGGGYSRSPRRRDEGSRSHPAQTPWRVIVENLSSRVSWQDLKDFMRTAGEVCYADAHRVHKNEGIVCFTNEAGMRRALQTLDSKELEGRKIKLSDGSRKIGSRSRSASRSRSGSRSPSRGKESSVSRSRSRSRSPRSRSRASRERSDAADQKRGVKRQHSGSSVDDRSKSPEVKGQSPKSDGGGETNENKSVADGNMEEPNGNVKSEAFASINSEAND